MFFDDQDHEQHDFHHRAESYLEQYPKDPAKLASQLLASKTEEIGSGQHRNVTDREDKES